MTASPDEHQQARAYLTDNASPDLTALLAAIEAAYGDGVVTGSASAAEQTGQPVAGSLATLLPTTQTGTAIDWAAWTPGNPAAAALLDDGGWTDLLDQAGITIRGIAQSVLNQMGTALADGVQAGDSVDTITKQLVEIMGNPKRAYMIADTEVNRAVSVATIRTYQQNSIGQYDILVSPDACDECVALEAGNPYSVDDSEAQPPIHPGCRCSASPVTPALV